MLKRARLLDSAGVDRLTVSEHVVFGERMDQYGRPEVGGQLGRVQPTGPDGHWLEPLTTLAVLAGTTRAIRLGTNILIAALRRPVVLAKATATLDVLSGGRLDLGVGVGWQREEYEAAGLDFTDRGALLDDSLAVCQALWSQHMASYDSRYLKFEAIHMMPKPLQAGGVPIWVSGTVNQRVVRRLARFGVGWIPWPWGDAPTNLAPAIVRMKDALAGAGHDPAGLRVVGVMRSVRRSDGSVDVASTTSAVPDLVAAGVTDIHSDITLPDDESAATDLMYALVASFRSVVGRSDSIEVH